MYLLKPVQGGFEVRTPGPLTYHFGSDGVLEKIVHKTGTTVSLSHENRWNKDSRRISRVVHSNGKSLEFSYDGTQVQYSYNPDGLVSEVSYPDGEITYGYDRDGLMVAASGVAGTVSNAYNEASWLSSTRGVDGTEVVYGYHPAGQVSNVATVAGTTGYALDAADRLSRIAGPSAAFDYAYNPWNGLASAVTNGVGLVAEYQYDIMDRPTNIVWRTPGGAELAGFQYAYNPVGMIAGRTVSMNGSGAVSTAYGYDGMDRLVSETGSDGSSRTYAYDLAGNRLSKTEAGVGAISYTLGVGDRLAAYTGGSYTYDAAGCVTSIERTGKPDLSMTWNGQYQLTSVSTNGVVAESYTYDPLGRRASTTSGGATVRHVYDGVHVIADLGEDGDLLKSYTCGPGIDNLLAVTCHEDGVTMTYYALTDIQGTVYGFADANGNIVARYTYDAWGNLLDADVAVSGLADNRYLFQGREYSWTTGLYNFRARWYDPATGRWISKDPIGISGGLNLYALCANDPVNYCPGPCEHG